MQVLHVQPESARAEAEYTERPVESVIEELKTITADIVLFSDDNFFTNPGRASSCAT